jgi:4-diphosphocytidyl-2-C-methyl-D-erythritol kinase
MLTLRAFAKINLDLSVLGRRADGYHDVRTVLQALDLHDSLRIDAVGGPFRLEGDAGAMPLDSSNLIWRAAETLWRAAGRRGPARGARIRVVKRIPSRAGLGGGSSDAAATLVGLNAMWRLRMRFDQMAAVAATLGADVPYFLYGGTALALGTGEQVFPLADLPRRYVVLAQPAIGVATADAYRWLSDARAEGAHPRPPASWPSLPAGGGNDFEPVVERRHPEIAAARHRLERAGAETARMSGSGSAVFGLFTRLRPARRAAASLDSAGYRVILCSTRSRSPVERRRLV